MLDFVKIIVKQPKKAGDPIVVSPEFKVGINKLKSVMMRGSSFYAIWDEDAGLWSRNEYDVIRLVDNMTRAKIEELPKELPVNPIWMDDFSSKKWTEWKTYTKSLPDNYQALDMKVAFSNTDTKREDYSSRRLNYPLEKQETPAYDEIMSTLYDPKEREKLEWAIGAIIKGDGKMIQKFIVLYGQSGSGKSTFLNILQMLFEGYWVPFNAKDIVNNTSDFALDQFKKDPLVAIQHDGDLSRIKDNSLLNSIVSHETLVVNEKFKSKYEARFQCFLFLGTNRRVEITEAKSGLIRRLIDVEPSGDKVKSSRYNKLMERIPFELGGIAYHCLEVYEKLGIHHYDHYIPMNMITYTNDFYNFIDEYFDIFAKQEYITLKQAWNLFKQYAEESRMVYVMQMRAFKDEFANYFNEFHEVYYDSNKDIQIRSVYKGFIEDKFKETKMIENVHIETDDDLIDFSESTSLFDIYASDFPAQYADKQERPSKKWDMVDTVLTSLDTRNLHYVSFPKEHKNHIVVDFDLKDENGNKSFERNLIAASKWPKTYAELSKSGAGIHLHYIYTGDVSKLMRIYDEDIEIKIFTGNASLRRKVTKCNKEQIATISSGLPLKGDTKVVSEDIFKNANSIRTMIKRNLNKEYHADTTSSVHYIRDILDKAYASGATYDVRNMQPEIYKFALNSTHQSEHCLDVYSEMKFCSKDIENIKEIEDIPMDDEKPLAIYDVEVFKNLFLLCYKELGEDKEVKSLFNPSPEQVRYFVENYRIIGFNNRNYDNHILWAAMLGYSTADIYRLSKSIIDGDVENPGFLEAYNISYTDILDFSSEKKSLKKFEIDLGIHHLELGLPWDEPAPENLWPKVAEYCANDVIATEALWNSKDRQADFKARKILVKLIDTMHHIKTTVNSKTNKLSEKLVFGNCKNPQWQFNWRDMSKPVHSSQYPEYRQRFGPDYKFRVWNDKGLPEYRDYIEGEVLPEGWSILPFFPGYDFNKFRKSAERSIYLGESIGEGGRVYTEPGAYWNVWDGDVSSMHPHSAIMECIFGPEFTKVFQELVDARVAIKHKDFEKARSMLNGALKEFLNEDDAKGLAQALKIIINSIYGLTSASFANAFKDPNNIDNIVAKRGALFMTLLKQEVQNLGYKVCHIKTDSIKIPDADDFIKDFVIRFGREYGYEFETEAEFSRFFLENKAVYVGLDSEGEWHTVGDRFQQPYVRKVLFTHEPIVFEDMCEVKSTTSAIYLDMNERLPDVSEKEKLLKKLIKKEAPQEDLDELKTEIEQGHNYRFVGKVGEFTPMLPGYDSGILLRSQDNKYNAVEGTSGYRWLESEVVRNLGLEEGIDKSYYVKMADEAIEVINKYTDYYGFVA